MVDELSTSAGGHLPFPTMQEMLVERQASKAVKSRIREVSPAAQLLRMAKSPASVPASGSTDEAQAAATLASPEDPDVADAPSTTTPSSTTTTTPSTSESWQFYKEEQKRILEVWQEWSRNNYPEHDDAENLYQIEEGIARRREGRRISGFGLLVTCIRHDNPSLEVITGCRWVPDDANSPPETLQSGNTSSSTQQLHEPQEEQKDRTDGSSSSSSTGRAGAAYVAADHGSAEDGARIIKHVNRRPSNWEPGHWEVENASHDLLACDVSTPSEEQQQGYNHGKTHQHHADSFSTTNMSSKQDQEDTHSHVDLESSVKQSQPSSSSTPSTSPESISMCVNTAAEKCTYFNKLPLARAGTSREGEKPIMSTPPDEADSLGASTSTATSGTNKADEEELQRRRMVAVAKAV
ncbi:unnamed protein product [Amoebophrya sp. A25]|nr:unnamed protein product [Amoebophrya sp. A25]|eukprot:GSA25T00026005001.1